MTFTLLARGSNQPLLFKFQSARASQRLETFINLQKVESIRRTKDQNILQGQRGQDYSSLYLWTFNLFDPILIVLTVTRLSRTITMNLKVIEPKSHQFMKFCLYYFNNLSWILYTFANLRIHDPNLFRIERKILSFIKAMKVQVIRPKSHQFTWCMTFCLDNFNYFPRTSFSFPSLIFEF